MALLPLLCGHSLEQVTTKALKCTFEKKFLLPRTFIFWIVQSRDVLLWAVKSFKRAIQSVPHVSKPQQKSFWPDLGVGRIERSGSFGVRNKPILGSLRLYILVRRIIAKNSLEISIRGLFFSFHFFHFLFPFLKIISFFSPFVLFLNGHKIDVCQIV